MPTPSEAPPPNGAAAVPTSAWSWLLLPLLVAACSTGPVPRPGEEPLPEPVDARLHLPAGSLLVLPPATIGEGKPRPTRSYLDALWRTAIGQSPHFDCAAGTEICEGRLQIELHYQPVTRSLTTTLARPGQAPVPLAAVRGEQIGRGLDVLAWQTRAALGEDVLAGALLPVPCTTAYSDDKFCVRFTEDGIKQLAAGRLPEAIRLFQQARRHDAASPVTLLHLAASLASRPDEKSWTESRRTAMEALELGSKLCLRTQHRLARVLLIKADNPVADLKLHELGTTYVGDRPHDPHGQFTVALALCRLGNYRNALPLLTGLRTRWPRNAQLRYQLGFALLATGDAEGALTVLEEARRGLSRGTLARPIAMALFHAGHHEELRRFLTDLRRQRGIRNTAAEREVMRMQASHALLNNQPAEAARHIAESFAWLRKTDSMLSQFALDVIEDGEVLARLGQRQVLADGVDGFLQLGQLPPAFANAMTYLGGLLAVLSKKPTTRTLATLEKSLDTVLHGQLQAAVFRKNGQLKAETAALIRVLAKSSDILSYANYARTLADAGAHKKYSVVVTYIRKRLLSFNQRMPHEHPLMSPGRAMAFVATRK